MSGGSWVNIDAREVGWGGLDLILRAESQRKVVKE